MSIQKLERVMQRVRKDNPGVNKVSRRNLEHAIMIECGTDPKTVINNKKALIRLGWTKSDGHWVRLTGQDIDGDLF